MILIQQRRPDSLVDIEHLSETLRLVKQSIGGLIPELTDAERTGMRDVLEIACGPGTWSLEMARTYPGFTYTGIDTSHSMIAIAQQEARERRLAVQFLQVSDLLGADFPDHSFDLISAHFLSHVLPKDAWSQLLQACYRMVRPGGWVRLTEFEAGSSNAPAHEELWSLWIQAMNRSGHGFSSGVRHVGILCELEPLLFSTGFSDTRSHSHVINYSYGAPLHNEWKDNLLLLLNCAQPLLVKTGVSTPEHLAQLYHQQQREMHVPTFHAILPMLTVIGRK
ncbi:hypothetical protein KSF_109230 [Reticulibacter mediterranei]|uniref:Methyltransferase domain-containing protein n=1 Tax=Reticulibacter mediterranei TaxID=2778369 RepID=A0A8J3J221_9CHLR|nr:class I SAM-dependent methyltransferase [Reticulibacter mediterranei]GHP00876.1 hypothetical protein KSF_109230 [Reticulibacter mediterranei]